MASFNEIPDPNRSPAAFAEFDPIGAPGRDTTHVLLVGIMLSAGSATALDRELITGELQGDGKFGQGAQLAEMCRSFKNLNGNAKVTAIGVSEPGAGTAAAGQFAITGPATEAGVLAVFIGGRRVAIAVANGDAASAIATALAAAINADGRLPVTAAPTSGNVAVTCRWKGVNGNDIPLHANLDNGDKLPAGVGVTITAMATGAGQPAMADVVGALEETVYDLIVCGFADAASMTTLEAEIDTRWTATRQLDGHLVVGALGDVAALVALGDARNSASSSIVGAGESPTPPWLWAAQVAARVAASTHPGVPLEGLTLPGVRPPATADRFKHSDRNLLLEDGVSTHKVDSGGLAIIDRLVTTYQKDGDGNPSETWRPLTRRRTAAFLRRDWVTRVRAKYQRKMVAADGTQVNPGVPMVTPSVFVGEAIAWFREKEREGHVEGLEAFKKKLAALRPSDDAERINLFLEPNLTNELVTIATLFAFRV